MRWLVINRATNKTIKAFSSRLSALATAELLIEDGIDAVVINSNEDI